MLSKLYKREFESLLRLLIPIWCAVIALAALSRLSIFIGEATAKTNAYGYSYNDNIYYNIANTSVIVFYVVAIFAMFVMCMAATVMRFYKNLFTSEGYLTLSLPFTPTQHIVCKLLCGVIVVIASFAVAALSVFIVGVGTEFMVTLSKQIVAIIRELTAYVTSSDIVNVLLFALEYLIIILLSIVSSLLQFYTSIALGQTFKSKVGGAVLCYAIIYAILQCLGTIFVIMFSILAVPISKFALSVGSISFTHLTLWFFILIETGIGVAFFFITRHMMDKKLNLE